MPKLTLDRERTLKWTMRTEFKLGSLPRPPSLADLDGKNLHRAFHSLCCHVWACLHDADAPASPEDVAEFLAAPEQQTAAITALYDTLVEAGRIKKKGPTATST